MEKTISHLRTKELEIKLTEEKLFINTSTSQETFALRSIQGIGVIDHVEEYNQNLTRFNQKKKEANRGLLTSIVGFFLGLIVYNSFGMFGVYIGGIFVVIGLIIYSSNSGMEEPQLMSSVRIMITGMQRDFSFNKANSNAVEVASFVAEVENTLSAYHKN